MATKLFTRPRARMDTASTYFRWQASEERTAALHAQHPNAREAHLAKADRYENQVRAIAARERDVRVRLEETG